MKLKTYIKRLILGLIKKSGYELKGIKKQVRYNDFDAIINFLLKDKKNMFILMLVLMKDKVSKDLKKLIHSQISILLNLIQDYVKNWFKILVQTRVLK